MQTVRPVLFLVSSIASRRVSQVGRERLQAAEVQQAHAVLVQGPELALDDAARESQQGVDLGRGRHQFSVEKAKSVRYLTSRSAKVSMTRRMFSVPARWPAWRERPRSAAQRPLPSMITATWRGTTPWRGRYG